MSHNGTSGLSRAATAALFESESIPDVTKLNKNCLLAKGVRRLEREERYKRARKGVDRKGRKIAHFGIWVTRSMVKIQRYLESIGLAFSRTVAGVFIGH